MSCFRNAPIPTKLDKESREVRVSYDRCQVQYRSLHQRQIKTDRVVRYDITNFDTASQADVLSIYY